MKDHAKKGRASSMLEQRFIDALYGYRSAVIRSFYGCDSATVGMHKEIVVFLYTEHLDNPEYRKKALFSVLYIFGTLIVSQYPDISERVRALSINKALEDSKKDLLEQFVSKS